MSIESIKQMNKEAEERAEEEQLEPYIAKHDEDAGVRGAPYIGDYIPEGWAKTENLFFVDNSGLGAEDEPAMTFNQFLRKVKKGLGYALVECGQFQVYIQEYRLVK